MYMRGSISPSGSTIPPVRSTYASAVASVMSNMSFEPAANVNFPETISVVLSDRSYLKMAPAPSCMFSGSSPNGHENVSPSPSTSVCSESDTLSMML